MTLPVEAEAFRVLYQGRTDKKEPQQTLDQDPMQLYVERLYPDPPFFSGKASRSLYFLDLSINTVLSL